MKKILFLALVLCGAMFIAGCGSKVDENKTPDQIKQEVAVMSADGIKAVIADYQKAIEAKTAELKAETEKLKKIPLAEQLGDNAKAVQKEIANIGESLKKLQANMAAYSEGLKLKK